MISHMNEKHIVAIDLGSYKVALLVAKINGDDIQVIYYKEARSEGIRNSYVFNSMKVTKPLQELIEDAESELNIKITQAVVGMPKYNVYQETSKACMDIRDEDCITEENVNTLKTEALDSYPLEHPDKEVLYGAVAQSFSTGEDFQFVENQIIGIPSDILEGNFKVFIGKKSSLRALDVAFNNLKIGIAKKYFTPEVLAKAVLTPSEMENGVALIDFGGGSTSVSVYYGSIMRHYASIPFGGMSVTTDIRNESMISDSLAENIKLAYGACMPDKLQTLSEKVIQINSGNGTIPNKQLPVKYLSEIITYRVKEITEAMLYEIEQSGFADNMRNGIVLTGGGANLTNCAGYIKELSGYNVRHGYPRYQLVSHTGCDGIRETNAAVCLGLLLAAKNDKIADCVQGETMLHVGATVTFGHDVSVEDTDSTENGRTGTDTPNTDTHGQGRAENEVPDMNPELFADDEIEKKSEDDLKAEKEKKKEEEKRRKEEEKKRKEEEKKKKPNVIWTTFNKVCRTLFEEDTKI